LLFSYAELLRDHFDKKLSLVPFEKLLHLTPNNPKYLSLRANVLLDLDFNDMAMRDYQHANELAKEEEGWILGNIGNLYNNRVLSAKLRST
jgi:Flp pilus assembly protein TadD